MSATDDNGGRLERAIATAYAGPLEGFVRRRDSLAKELRSSGDRESATTVKGLRKPSRTAWALNVGALGTHNAIEPLVAAVAELLEAQTAGRDVRAAIATLRSAVRTFAGDAANASEEEGHRIEPGVLANAVLAVLGNPESFNQLRGGFLTDVPEAGGLDFLARLPTPTSPPAAPATACASAPAHSSPSRRAGLETAGREAVRQAAGVLADARSRSVAAQQAFHETESMVQAAEERVRKAEADERAARDQCERARQELKAAADRLLAAERAAAEAERRLSGATRQRS
jgi:hypothetical protein